MASPGERITQADLIVSQFGSKKALVKKRPFRHRPRYQLTPPELELSVTLGSPTPEEAAALVGYNRGGAGVRRTTVGHLEAAGFVVVADPLPQNPDHALVKFEGHWDEGVSDAFDLCFIDTEWEGGYGDE